MQAKIVKELNEFYYLFVNTHHFYFINFLLSKVQNKDKRENALVELNLKINGIPSKISAEGVEKIGIS